MTFQKDKILPSGKTLGQVRTELKKMYPNGSQSKKPLKYIPSMTLEEQRREGLSTEPILVISFGRRKKK